MSLIRRPLSEGWTVQAAGRAAPETVGTRRIPAEVPGEVPRDLLRAGLIPDPSLDDHEAHIAWIGREDFTYRTTLTMTAAELEAHRRHVLVFEGIDTVAEVRLDGELLGRTENQHRSHRFPVDGLLRPGEHELTVAITSPIRHADAESMRLGPRQRPYPHPYEAIRKSACSFGWDWGIAVAGSGLWKPVMLESWSHARLDAVRLRPEIDVVDGRDRGQVTLIATVEDDVSSDRSGEELALRLRVGDVEVTGPITPGERETELRIDVGAVERWWPAGHGEQPLYDVDVELVSGVSDVGGGRVLDVRHRRIGFRTARWAVEADDDGTSMQLLVNERPIYVKGVNWVPDDALITRVDRNRLSRRLRQARSAHVNLVRVWGGGIYESDDFYDLCDELGLLTWQDFLFACAGYPEEEPLGSEVEAEAREAVTRLGHHASLIMFCGNNENLWGYEDWGWKELLDGRSWGAHYYHRMLPAIVEELAPHVPYTPGSPFSPGDHHPNDEAHGSTHLWQQWNERDWTTYREHRPRFVAEFGWQAPPVWTTLRRAVGDDPLTPESPGMIVHQKAEHGNDKLSRGLITHARVPTDMETWHWAMQLNQAHAVGTALAWFRSQAPRNTGAVVWQLNDCWPVTSWAVVDGDEREKPLLHALRAAFAPRAMTLQPDVEGPGRGLQAAISNDTDASWTAQLRLRRLDFLGRVMAEETLPIDAAPRSSVTVTVPDQLRTSQAPSRELLVADLDQTRSSWAFAELRDAQMPAIDCRVELDPQTDGVDVVVTAEVVVPDLTLMVDRLVPEARVDAGLLTLLPGESAVLRLRPADRVPEHERRAVVAALQGLTVDEVTAVGVLRSAADLADGRTVGDRQEVPA